jgi:hypothetical protein
MALACTLMVVAPAGAQLATIGNGAENVTMAPVDALLAPAIAARTLRTNLGDTDMSTFGQGTTWFVGMPWISTLQWVLTGARIVSGFAEMGLGLALTPVSLFTDVRERQLFDATGASPLVNREGPFDLVIGGHYVSSH